MLKTVALASVAAPAYIPEARGADGYPNKYIRLIIPYSPGTPDVHARFFADALAKRLNATIVADNRPGASGQIGAAAAARAPADGYTLLWAAGSLFGTNPFLFRKLPYALDEFEAVGVFSEAVFVFAATPGLKVRTFADVIERAKREPGKLNYANPSIGNQMHLTWERVRKITGADATLVTYRGYAAMVTAMLTGESDFTCAILSKDVLEHFEAGTLQPLAVTTPGRHPDLPNVPTMIESGFPNFTASGTYQVFVPKGVPPAILGTLVEALRAIKREPETLERLRQLAALPGRQDGPAETLAYLREDQEIWRDIIAFTGIKLD